MEALRRGADRVLGIDMVDNIEFKEVNLNGKADFLLMDIMSSNFWAVPMHEIVLCAGVLYHVSDPVGLLRRLKMVTFQTLVLETAYREGYPCGDGTPTLSFCPKDSFDNNPSNWFLPNYTFLRDIAREVGFEITKTIKLEGGRICLHLVPIYKLSQKLLPRKPEYMKS